MQGNITKVIQFSKGTVGFTAFPWRKTVRNDLEIFVFLLSMYYQVVFIIAKLTSPAVSSQCVEVISSCTWRRGKTRLAFANDVEIQCLNQRFYKQQKSRLQVVPKKSGQNIRTSASLGGRATWGTPLACPPRLTRALGFKPFFNSLQLLF